MEVSLPVINRGNGPDAAELALGELTPPGSVDDPWMFVADALDITPIAPGETGQRRLRVTAPVKAHPGDHTLIIDAWSQESFAGTRQRDVMHLTFRVIQSVDLQFCPALRPGCHVGELDGALDIIRHRIAPGGSTRYLIPVLNRGNLADTPTIEVFGARADGQLATERGLGLLPGWQVAWSEVTEWDGDQALLRPLSANEDGTARVGELRPWQLRLLALSVMPPPDAAHTSYTIGLRLVSTVEPGNSSADPDADTNWATGDTNELHLEVQVRAPNLSIAQVRAEVLDDDSLVTLRVRVQNQGDDLASPVVVEVCDQSSPEAISCAGELIHMRHSMVGLGDPPAGGSTSADILLLVPQVAAAGPLLVVVDPDQQVLEKSEIDNTYVVPPSLPTALAWREGAGALVADQWQSLLLGTGLLIFVILGTLAHRDRGGTLSGRVERTIRERHVGPTAAKARMLPPGSRLPGGKATVDAALKAMDELVPRERESDEPKGADGADEATD